MNCCESVLASGTYAAPLAYEAFLGPAAHDGPSAQLLGDKARPPLAYFLKFACNKSAYCDKC